MQLLVSMQDAQMLQFAGCRLCNACEPCAALLLKCSFPAQHQELRQTRLFYAEMRPSALASHVHVLGMGHMS